MFTERDNKCEQPGAVKRAAFQKPADQTTIEIAGASNPTWAGALPEEALAAAGAAAGDAGQGADGAAPADEGTAPADGEATGVDVG